MADVKETALHIYHDGAVVIETRVIDCTEEVTFNNISDKIQDNTFIVHELQLVNYQVRKKTAAEQDALLDTLLGEKVNTLSLRKSEQEVKEEVRSGILIARDSKSFTALADEQQQKLLLITEPVVEVSSERSVPKFVRRTHITAQFKPSDCSSLPVHTSYQTSGMNWTASYDLLLSRDYSSMTIRGKLRVLNETAVTYKAARIRVVHGRLFQMAAAQPRSLVQSEYEVSGAEYDSYDLPERMSIEDIDDPQFLTFVQKEDIVAERKYVMYTDEASTAQLSIHWKNDRDSMLFPPGLYTLIRTGSSTEEMELLGDTYMQAIPPGRAVEMNMGNVSSIRGRREIVRGPVREQRPDTSPGKVFEINDYKLIVHNDRDEAVSLTLLERLEKLNWTIRDASYTVNAGKSKSILFSRVETKPNSEAPEHKLAKAVIDVPAGSKAVLLYSVEYESTL